MARLMLLHIAYKAEKGLDLRQENSIAKVFLAHMVHKVVDTAIQLHGALGYSRDTPLAAWYTHIRSQRLEAGPDEVHRWTVVRNVIKAFERDGTTAAAAGGDLIWEEARSAGLSPALLLFSSRVAFGAVSGWKPALRRGGTPHCRSWGRQGRGRRYAGARAASRAARRASHGQGAGGCSSGPQPSPVQWLQSGERLK